MALGCGTNPETDSLIIPKKSIADIFCQCNRDRDSFFHPFLFFLCGRRFYHYSSRRPQHRESCDVEIRRVGSSIFRSTSRKNILKDSWRPSRGNEGGRAFFILFSALNSAPQCRDGASSLKNAVEWNYENTKSVNVSMTLTFALICTE